jgi:plasmid stability protein
MNLRVKITPRVSVAVARRLRLAAGLRSRSMSAVVNEVLDAGLPSLDEIRAQLAVADAGEGGGDVRDR